MSAYRLRRQGREFLVIDRPALLRMVETGQVRPDDEAWLDNRWVPALTLPDAKAPTPDLWDAWDDAAEAPAEQVIAAFHTPEEVQPEPLPEARAKLVIHKRAEPTPVPPSRDVVSRPPVAAPTELSDIEPQPLGEVIAFPRRTAPKLPEFPPNTPRGAPPIVRTARLLGFLFIGVTFLGMGWLWVLAQGQTAGVRPTAAPELAPVKTTAGDPHRELLNGMRGRLPQEVQAVRAPPDLGDAMLIELQNLGTTVESVNAEVTKWTGPKGDQPREATVTVTFVGTGNLERDLGAYALVLGRYMRAYPLKFSDARAAFRTDTGVVGRPVNADLAVDVYSGKLPLQKFLDDG